MEFVLGGLLGLVLGMLIIADISVNVINKYIKQNKELSSVLEESEQEIVELKETRHEEIKRNFKLSKILEQIYKTINDEKLSSAQCNVKIKELLLDWYQNSSKI